jgi:hypothetical protein
MVSQQRLDSIVKTRRYESQDIHELVEILTTKLTLREFQVLHIILEGDEDFEFHDSLAAKCKSKSEA